MKDGKDRKMLEMLRKDARMSNVGLAKAVGLTEGAVRARITRMVRNGTIRRFTIETGSENAVFAVVMLKAKRSTKQAMREIVASDMVKEAYEISGEFDGCIVLEGNSIGEIDQKIDRIRRCRDVADTRTFITVKKWV